MTQAKQEAIWTARFAARLNKLCPDVPAEIVASVATAEYGESPGRDPEEAAQTYAIDGAIHE